MSAPQARRAQLLAALYARFGEPAAWTPAAGGAAAAVTVRAKNEEAVVGFGASEVIAAQNFLRVRVAEVVTARKGDQAAVGEAPDVRTFKVIGDPRLVHSGLEWLCEVKAV